MRPLKLIILTAALLMVATFSHAQTNPPSAAPGFFQAQVGTIFGLYDTNVNYYEGTNQFSLNTGLSYKSTAPGIQQELEPTLFHNFGGAGWLGLGINIDTLGQAGNNLDAAGVHGYWKYASHNIAGLLALGYQRDIDAHKNAVEGGFGFEGYLSPHAGIFAKYMIGVEGTKHASTYGRLIAGAAFKF